MLHTFILLLAEHVHDTLLGQVARKFWVRRFTFFNRWKLPLTIFKLKKNLYHLTNSMKVLGKEDQGHLPALVAACHHRHPHDTASSSRQEEKSKLIQIKSTSWRLICNLASKCIYTDTVKCFSELQRFKSTWYRPVTTLTPFYFHCKGTVTGHTHLFCFCK